LEQELAEFTETPSGSGLDVPAWLIALAEEVDRCQRRDERGGEAGDLDPPGPQLRLTWDAALQRLKGDED
jgi:hypothetical protein